MSRHVRRGDSFSFSSSSGLSRNSGEHGRKPPRFSLRRLFCRRPTSARCVRTVHSQSEIESQSVSSLQGSSGDKELSSKGNSAEDSHVVYKKTKDGMECPVCMTCQPKENFPLVMTCHHRSCRDCLKKYLRIEITESRINIACPECNEKFHPNDIKSILEDEDLMLKYEEFMLRRVLVLDPDTRWCPAPDCGYAVIATRCASCPRIRCEAPGCNTLFCYHCKQHWHPNQTCDAARAERSSNLRSSSISYSNESGTQNEIKPCPRCGAFIVKMDDGSCNHMTCAVCGAEFCWLCMKEISDLHYLSPSGCTFWGKKPWSRKKKILWQLGTLVGAPVGITLIAGIAVPAIIIGVPVWVGRRLHSRYDYMTKHTRNMIMAGGIISSILISPVLAGLAVGIGVPILLAYVYGVVPISLCRSGGCGVTTTNSGGVRFDFDDDNETPTGASAAQPGLDTQSIEHNGGHNIANPSIGPSIGEMSMAMTNSLSASGSHLDRFVGMLRDDMDRDSSSNRAIIGASLNGSVSSSTVAGPSGYHNRLEIHADVSAGTHKRSSISSESANFSLDAKSGTVSFGDDASTKALAGSLCFRDKDNSSGVVPLSEVQLDVMAASVQYHNEAGSSTAGHIPTDTTPGARGDHTHGSPTSSRSTVNFLGEEVLGASHGMRKFSTRNSVSIGNSICESVEQLEGHSSSPRSSSASFMDSLSVGGGSTHDYDSLFVHGRSRASSAEPSASYSDNLTSSHHHHQHQTHGRPSVTEVESDRPHISASASPGVKRGIISPGFDVVSASSSESTSTGIVSVIHKNPGVAGSSAAGGPSAGYRPSHVHTKDSDDDSLSYPSTQAGGDAAGDDLSVEVASLANSSASSIGSGVCETTVLIEGGGSVSSSSS